MTDDIEIRVRYAETDRMGLLHHANYLVYFEQARTELLRSQGFTYKDMEDQGFLLVLTRVQVRYRRPALYDDVLTIRTTVARTTAVKIEHKYEVLRKGELLAEAETTLGCVNREGQVQLLPEFCARQSDATEETNVRRFVIQTLLPFVLCLVPILVAGLLALAVPAQALNFYVERVMESRIDWIILGLGTVMFILQMSLAWRALRWRGNGFDERVDRWVSSLAQTAEWFPLLGLFGTVASILQTFSQVAVDSYTGPKQIIQMYSPAMTATSSGLFMALINILPSWVILLGRDIIMTLGGKPGRASSEVRP